jgi:hypothetical protein
MRRLLASLAVISVVSLTACGGGAASSGVNGGSSKSNPTAEVNSARAEAEAQERKLSDLRQQKADLEAQLEGKAAPAPTATPAPVSAPAKADSAKPVAAPATK